MKPSQDLFELIKSMDKQEKIFFKKSTRFQSKGQEKQYLKVFDAIDKQEEYDEAALLKKFKNEKFTNNFSVAKAYLYQITLKSLRAFYSGKNPEAELREIIDNVDLLLEKGLFNQALKHIKKGEKLARENECLDELKLLQVRFIRLIQSNRNEYSLEKLDEFFESYFTSIDLISNYAKYAFVNVRLIFMLSHLSHLPRKDLVAEIEKLVDREELKSIDNAKSALAKRTYYTIWRLYYNLKGQHHKEYEHTQKLLKLYDDNPNIIKTAQEKYIGLLVNTLRCLYALPEKLEDLQELIARAEAVKTKSNYVAMKKFLVRYYATSLINDIKKDYTANARALDGFKEEMKQFGDNLPKDDQIAVLYNGAFACFASGDHEKSAKILLEVVNEKKYQFRKDAMGYATLLQLLNTYNHNEFEYLNYQANSAYRKFKKERPKGFETVFCREMSKAAEKISKEGESEFLENLKESLQAFAAKDEENKFGFSPQTLITWINAREKGVSYESVMQSTENKNPVK